MGVPFECYVGRIYSVCCALHEKSLQGRCVDLPDFAQRTQSFKLPQWYNRLLEKDFEITLLRLLIPLQLPVQILLAQPLEMAESNQVVQAQVVQALLRWGSKDVHLGLVWWMIGLRSFSVQTSILESETISLSGLKATVVGQPVATCLRGFCAKNEPAVCSLLRDKPLRIHRIRKYHTKRKGNRFLSSFVGHSLLR